MFDYFYHEIFRKTIIAFGTLFNSIEIRQTNSADSVVNIMKVPRAYGPTQKFLARLEQSPDLNKPTQMTLPRMSFEFTGVTQDPSRKITATQQFIVKNPNVFLQERLISSSRCNISCHSGIIVHSAGANKAKLIDVLNENEIIIQKCWAPLFYYHVVKKSSNTRKIKISEIFEKIANLIQHKLDK